MAILALVLGVCVTACSRHQPSSVSAAPAVLRVGSGVEPRDLDPQTNVGAPEGVMISALFEGLVSLAGDGVTITPGVAERWEVSADNRVYTFHLRANARWSNGDVLTARDFTGSWQRLLDPAVAAELAYLAHDIQGAEAFHTGRTTDFSTVGVRAIDNRTLQVTLAQPSPYFLLLLARYPFLPVHLPSVTAAGGLHRQGAGWTRPGMLVSNGPFRLKTWVPHQELVVEKNPNYWDASHVGLTAVHFLPLDRAETEEAAFRTGQLDVTRALPVVRLEVWRREHLSALRMAPRLGVTYLEFNVRHGPLADARVRRALALSIDRTRLASDVAHNGQPPASTILRPSADLAKTEANESYNPDEARRLLAEAGFGGGRDFPVLRYLYNTNELNRDIAEALQEMWRRELGISVVLVNQEWKVFLDSRSRGDFDLVRSAWQPFTPDPFDPLAHFQSDSRENHSGWADANYDRLARSARLEIDLGRRAARCRELDAVLSRETPVTPLYYLGQTYLAGDRVANWPDNELGFRAWKDVRLTP